MYSMHKVNQGEERGSGSEEGRKKGEKLGRDWVTSPPRDLGAVVTSKKVGMSIYH